MIARQGSQVWCFPKGLIEKGESSESAALREIEEETGLKGLIDRKLGDVQYGYVLPEERTRFFKKVSFFLVRHTGGNTRNHDFEVDQVGWFSLKEALGKLTYESERKLMRKAAHLLGKRGDR